MSGEIPKQFQENEGDDMGMQTKVWGPTGWIFLHCIAQNYPYNPDCQQRQHYLKFFKLVGKVLPCRYCRESYHKFVKEPDTLLKRPVVANRYTLTKWLYDIHNKVNAKLNAEKIAAGIPKEENPSFEEVWKRYSSIRSKCSKNPAKIDKPVLGCVTPADGNQKLCSHIVIGPVSKLEGSKTTFGFGFRVRKKVKVAKKTNKVLLKSIKKSTKSGKKFMAVFDKKTIHFGQSGASDFTKHKDVSRRARYITRHRKDLKTNDPTRAGFLSMFVLWNKKSLQASIRDYRRRLNVFNKTGKFPISIK
jgi:hypothetical protein